MHDATGGTPNIFISTGMASQKGKSEKQGPVYTGFRIEGIKGAFPGHIHSDMVVRGHPEIL